MELKRWRVDMRIILRDRSDAWLDRGGRGNAAATAMSAPLTKRRGFTMLELLVVISVLGLVLAIAVPRFRGLSNELQNAERATAGFFRQTRAEAMTTTSAYRVIVDSGTRLRAEFARTCGDPDADWTVDSGLPLQLEERTSFEGVSADSTLICFNSRGVGDANPTLRVRQRYGDASDIEVFVGGAVRTTPVGA